MEAEGNFQKTSNGNVMNEKEGEGQVTTEDGGGMHSRWPSSRIVRVSGGKDRHSKVLTSRGLRDRRVRLAVNTAIQFYDLQDRLGFNQPSKAIEWLLNAAETSIAELPPITTPFPNEKPPSDGDAENSGVVTKSSNSEGGELSVSRSEIRSTPLSFIELLGEGFDHVCNSQKPPVHWSSASTDYSTGGMFTVAGDQQSEFQTSSFDSEQFNGGTLQSNSSPTVGPPPNFFNGAAMPVETQFNFLSGFELYYSNVDAYQKGKVKK